MAFNHGDRIESRWKRRFFQFCNRAACVL